MENKIDTIGWTTTVDSLINEVELGVTQVNQYRQQRDSLDNAYKNFISIKDSTIKVQDSTIITLNNFAFVLQLEIQKLQGNIVSANEEILKLSKRFKSAKKAALIFGALNLFQAGLSQIKK
jgi:hypothetical protein